MCEALWMQIFVFLQSMWRKEQSGLSDSRTFQPHGGGEGDGGGGGMGGLSKKTHKKKHEILAFKALLQEIRLKNPIIRKIFLRSNV